MGCQRVAQSLWCLQETTEETRPPGPGQQILGHLHRQGLHAVGSEAGAGKSLRPHPLASLIRSSARMWRRWAPGRRCRGPWGMPRWPPTFAIRKAPPARARRGEGDTQMEGPILGEDAITPGGDIGHWNDQLRQVNGCKAISCDGRWSKDQLHKARRYRSWDSESASSCWR